MMCIQLLDRGNAASFKRATKYRKSFAYLFIFLKPSPFPAPHIEERHRENRQPVNDLIAPGHGEGDIVVGHEIPGIGEVQSNGDDLDQQVDPGFTRSRYPVKPDIGDAHEDHAQGNRPDHGDAFPHKTFVLPKQAEENLGEEVQQQDHHGAEAHTPGHDLFDGGYHHILPLLPDQVTDHRIAGTGKGPDKHPGQSEYIPHGIADGFGHGAAAFDEQEEHQPGGYADEILHDQRNGNPKDLFADVAVVRKAFEQVILVS